MSIICTHNWNTVPEQTMRELLGNKARILDAIGEYSKNRRLTIKVDFSTSFDDTRQLYISAVYPPKDTPIEGTARIEKYICINYANRSTDKFAITDAHNNFFKDKDVHVPTISNTVYRDWVFPSNKKLYQIMEKLF